MARSRSAVLSVDDRKGIRGEIRALKEQHRYAKSTVKTHQRDLKNAERQEQKLAAQIEKLQTKLASDKDARAAA